MKLSEVTASSSSAPPLKLSEIAPAKPAARLKLSEAQGTADLPPLPDMPPLPEAKPTPYKPLPMEAYTPEPGRTTKPLLPDEPGASYASMLPIGRRPLEGGKDSELFLAVPGMLRSAIRSFELPGRAMRGDPLSEQEMMSGAQDIALGAAFPMGQRTFGPSKPPSPRAVPGTEELPKPPGAMDVVDVTVMPEGPKTPTQTAKDAAIGLRNIFSPTSAGPNAKLAETAIRDYEGTGLRNRTIAEHELAAFTAKGDQLVRNPAELAKFYSYVQGRSKGVKLEDPELQPFADELRRLATDTEKELRALPQTEDMGFITDYFPQMWKNQDAAREFAQNWVGRQGNSKFTKARKYPTIEDGMKAGLELADPNPANSMLSYITNTQKYISQAKVFNEGRELGLIKYGTPGKVPDGWVPLQGKYGSTPPRTIQKETGETITVPARQAYAPADYALIYNNYLSKGFEATKAADVYKAVRSFKNAQTMLQLGFSTHHMATIIQQSAAQDVVRALSGAGGAVKNIAKGNIKGAKEELKAAAGATADLATTLAPFAATSAPLPSAVKAPLAIASAPLSRTYRRGKKLREQYEGIKDYGPEMEARAKLFATAGGRVGEDPMYRGSTHKSLLQSYNEGTLRREFGEGIDEAIKTKGFSTPMQAVQVAGRLADTVAHPLFNRYIPNMKIGAFDSMMGDWMRKNPDASPEAIRLESQHIMDLLDERLGEIADSNIFWDRTTKQVLGVMFRAPNWNLGLVRQSFGALADTGKAAAQLAKTGSVSPKLLDRPKYLLGYALLLAGMNTAMGYLKTGQMPDEPVDLITYETGGKTPGGYDERALLPGHPKEIIHMFPKPGGSPTSGLADLLGNKWSSPVTSSYEAYKNENWRGDPIGGYGARAWHVLAEPFMPLQLQQMYQGAPVGSELSFPERFMNINQAPAAITERQRLESINRNMKAKAERKKQRNENREKARYPDRGM
jgi:hypothetical protein